MALSRGHTSAKAADVAKLLLINKQTLPCGILFGPHLTVTITVIPKPNVT